MDRTRWAVLITVLLIPISVKVYFLAIDLELIFPAEPLLGLLALAMVWSMRKAEIRVSLRSDLLLHPITLTLIAFLLLSALSAVLSVSPLISAKAVLVRTTYALVFYGYFLLIPLEEPFRAKTIRAYALGFFFVVLYALAQQWERGFDRPSASFVPFPFYTDHTVYAAALVFVVLFLAVMFVAGSKARSRWSGILEGGVLLICVWALVVSFCRAAWIGTFAALVLCPFLFVRIRTRYWVIGASAILLLGLGMSGKARALLMSEATDSYADNAGWKESIRSIANLNNDSSNKERLNRWKCALRMAKDRPIVGTGPGTFQFEYLRYQKPDERTYLSVDGPIPPARITRSWSLSDDLFVRANPQLLHISGGTAHSEYLLTLAESGAPALLLQLTLIGLALVIGVRNFRARSYPGHGRLVLYAVLALFAYAVHGLFNNYLDDCKIAFLFYGTLVIIARADVERRRNTRSNEASTRVLSE